MTLLLILSLIFIILAIVSAVRGSYGERFDVYFFTMVVLAAVAAILPIRHMLFEHRLAVAAEQLIGHEQVIVDCNSYFDSIFHLGAAGFVYRGSGVINLEVRTCDRLRDYLDNPSAAGPNERYSLHVLTHEAMHVAGVYDEILTDCKAFQRNHKTASLLGVAGNIAVWHAREIHRSRSPQHPYYSAECEPGGPMDDKLPGAVWKGP